MGTDLMVLTLGQMRKPWDKQLLLLPSASRADVVRSPRELTAPLTRGAPVLMAPPVDSSQAPGRSETYVSLEDIFTLPYLQSPLPVGSSIPGCCDTRGRDHPDEAESFSHPACQP